MWTKDGTRVAFASDRDGGPPQLYWRPSDRSASAERLLATDYAVFPGSWFPDEPTVAFQANRDSWDIGLLTVGDSIPRWVLETEFDEIHPQVSPDGLWLAYTSDRSGSQEVYVVAATGEGGQYPVSYERWFGPSLGPRRERALLRGGRNARRGVILDRRRLSCGAASQPIRRYHRPQRFQRQLRRPPRWRGLRRHQSGRRGP